MLMIASHLQLTRFAYLLKIVGNLLLLNRLSKTFVLAFLGCVFAGSVTAQGTTANISASFGAIPAVVSPGQSLAGLTLVCANAGPSSATDATCLPTVDEGTVSNVFCAPAAPVDVASGDDIRCTFDYVAPGTAGGSNTGPIDVIFTGTTSAVNDSSPANNVDTANVDIIDAVDDITTVLNATTGNTFTMSLNDQVPAGSSFSIAPGSSCANLSVSEFSATATFDAVPSLTCTVEYQVCASAPNDSVCDTATLTVTIETPVLTIVKSLVSIDDTNGDGAGLDDQINYQVVVTNTGNLTLNNVVVTDPLITPSSVTCATVDVGNTCVLNGSYIVTAPDVTAGFVANTASVTSNEIPGPTDSQEIVVNIVQPPVNPLPASLSGLVFLDEDSDDAFDPSESALVGWIIELSLNDALVGTAVAAADGSYEFTNLVPSAGYDIRLRHPDTDVTFGMIEDVELVAGQNLVAQNLPVDPSGVVYDSTNRTPVPNTLATIVDGAGNPLPTACVLPGQQNQTTAADGFYRFDLVLDADPACPSGGSFALQFVAPPSFEDAPSSVIPAEIGSLDPTGLGDPFEVQPQSTAPTLGQATTYFLEFVIENGDPNVINNHIPLDPAGALGLTLVKTVDRDTVRIGDLVGYQVAVTNTGGSNLVGLSLIDTPPGGFTLVEGSVSISPDLGALTVTGARPMTVGSFNLDAGDTAVVSYVLRVGAGVVRGEYTNIVSAQVGGTPIGNISEASVEVIADPDFEQTTIIGKVFDDQNANGLQDEGEYGIPGVRLATVTGLLIETDSEGRYHIAAVDVERFERGRNFYLKLDTATLPDSAEVVTENPRVMRITQGLLNQINFGVKLASQDNNAQLEIGEVLFYAGETTIRDEYRPLLDEMTAHIIENQAGDLTILARAGNEQLAVARATALRDELMSRLNGANYPVSIGIKTETSGVPIASVGHQLTLHAEFFFDTAKSDIRPSASPLLDELAYQLRTTCEADVKIEGHTDFRNVTGINPALSEARAKAVHDALIARGAFNLARDCVFPTNAKPEDRNENPQSRILPVEQTKTMLKQVAAAMLSVFITPAYAQESDCTLENCVTSEGVVVKLVGRAAELQRTPGNSPEALQDNRRVDVDVDYAADGRDLATVTTTRRATVADVGSLWLTEDPLIIDPKFAFSTPFGNEWIGNALAGPIYFDFYTNYAAFQDHVMLTIFDDDDVDRVSPVAQIKADPSQFGQFAWTPEQVVSPGDRFYAMVEVISDDGLVDTTVSRQFELFDEQQLTTQELTTREALPFASVYGRTDLATQRIPLHGSRVRVHGDIQGFQSTVTINDEPMPVDNANQFAVEYILPVGTHDFDIQVASRGQRLADVNLQTDVRGEYMFLAGLADITASDNDISGSLEALSGDDRFEEDFLVDGRFAFYLKGKIQGKYLITAQLDTREGEIDEIFGDVLQEDPTALFRRLDPDVFYPVYGDDSTTVSDVDTQGRFFLRVDWDNSQVLWGNYHTGLNGTEFAQYNRSLYGAKLEHNSNDVTDLGESKTHLKAFVSEAQSAFGHTEFLGTGGSLYYLPDTNILPGSEKVSVEIRDRDSNLVVDRITLIRDQDYEVDEIQGRIILVRPLSQIQSRQQSIIRDDPLDGDLSFLLVDYEYVPDNFSPDEATVGVRGKQWVNDSIALGGTYVQEGRGAEDYELIGVDLTLQRGLGTYINLEYATTESSQSDSFFSDNGGLSFSQGAQTSDLNREGDAVGVTARVNLQEQGLTDKPWTVGVWWRRTDEGFSVARRDDLEEVTEAGIEIHGQVTDKLAVGVRATSVERGLDTEDEQLSLMLRYDFTGSDQISLELRSVRERNQLQPDSVTGSLAALQYTRAISYRVDVYGTIQGTLDDDSGAYEDNNLVAIGLRAGLNDKATLNAEVVSGNRGEAATVGLDYARTERHSLYGSFTHSTDRTEALSSGDRFTLGNRWNVSNQTEIFSENQFIDNDRGAGLTHAFGIDYQPYEGVVVGATLQTGELESIAGVIDRDAVSLRAGVSRDLWQWRSAVEFRSDDGAEDADQWVTTNRFNYKFNDSLRVVGRVNHSETDDEINELGDARFTEAGIGLALRPANSDKFNLLYKYTFLYDLPSLGQSLIQTGGTGTDQRSNILSLEGVYQFNSRWKLGAKVGQRESELRADRSSGEWFESTANFAAIRGRYHLISSWDALLEYRILEIEEEDSIRDGFLFSIDRHIADNFKLGIGYNFTDFSDDLSDLDYDQEGWFINAVGKY